MIIVYLWHVWVPVLPPRLCIALFTLAYLIGLVVTFQNSLEIIEDRCSTKVPIPLRKSTVNVIVFIVTTFVDV